MNKKVLFTAMEHGTQEDYDIVTAHERADIAQQADRVLGWLRQMDGDSPYQISRLHHCLQTATRAENDGADDETVACALLHDIGDILTPSNHSRAAAALIEPYVSDKNYWIVKHHGLFQGYYYFHFKGQDRGARDKYRHPSAATNRVRGPAAGQYPPVRGQQQCRSLPAYRAPLP